MEKEKRYFIEQFNLLTEEELSLLNKYFILQTRMKTLKAIENQNNSIGFGDYDSLLSFFVKHDKDPNDELLKSINNNIIKDWIKEIDNQIDDISDDVNKILNKIIYAELIDKLCKKHNEENNE